jgi:hypothetical protein
VVDTGGVDTNHFDAPRSGEPLGSRWVQARKVQLLYGRAPRCGGAQILQAIGPSDSKAGVQEHDRLGERRLVSVFPCLKVVDRHKVVAIHRTRINCYGDFLALGFLALDFWLLGFSPLGFSPLAKVPPCGGGAPGLGECKSDFCSRPIEYCRRISATRLHVELGHPEGGGT